MNLPKPGPSYDAQNEAAARAAMEREDANNQKRLADVELNGDSAISGRRLILKSPNGTRYRVLVSDAGALSTVAL